MYIYAQIRCDYDSQAMLVVCMRRENADSSIAARQHWVNHKVFDVWWTFCTEGLLHAYPIEAMTQGAAQRSLDAC
jgi:hypothetical protein